MSRAFVNEDSQQEPVRIPPRPSLPEKATNYVTPEGLEQLYREKEDLEAEKAELSLDNKEDQRQITLVNGKLQQLQERIETAQKIDLNKQPQDEVRFGATVTLELQDLGKTKQFQIVGVDQADFRKRKISFLSPIARAITGSKMGETVKLKRGKNTRHFKVLNICYSQ